jgi:hypothetical protein
MRDEIKEAFKELSHYAGSLTQGQLDFIKGLQHYYIRYKTLTEKQRKVLFDIRDTAKGSAVTEQKLSA